MNEILLAVFVLGQVLFNVGTLMVCSSLRKRLRKLLGKVVQLQTEQDEQRALHGQLTSNILNHLITLEARVDKLDPDHPDD